MGKLIRPDFSISSNKFPQPENNEKQESNKPDLYELYQKILGTNTQSLREVLEPYTYDELSDFMLAHVNGKETPGTKTFFIRAVQKEMRRKYRKED